MRKQTESQVEREERLKRYREHYVLTIKYCMLAVLIFNKNLLVFI